MFFKVKPATKSRFADFIRNASSAEKKRLYTRVLKKAADRQNDLVARASTSGMAFKAR